MSQLEVQTSHTPAFVREFCTQKFMLYTSVLDEIIMGGLQLEPEAAEALKKRGHVIKGGLVVATTEQRLKAIEMYGKFGPGIRTDHRSEDGPPRRSVVLMPPWEDEDPVEAEDVTPRKALPRGNGRKNGEPPQ